MPSNTQLDTGSGGDQVVTKQVSHDGDTAKLQMVGLMGITGTEDSYTIETLTKAEDTAHTSGDAGLMALAVRNDSLAALAGTDGDYAPLQVNASGALFVQEGAAMDVSAATVTVNLGANNDVTIDGSSIVKAEDAGHSSGDAGVMALVVRNDTLAALAGTDGDYAPLQVNATGALFVQQGAAMDVSAATVTVDLAGNNDVTIDASSIVKTEDAAHSSGDAGVMSLAVRRDANTTLVGTDGDYAPFQVDANGYLKVEIFDGGGSHTVDNAGTFATQVDGDALTALQLIDNIVVVEDAAHSSGDSGVMPLAVRNDELATLTGTDGDYAPLQVGVTGAQYVTATPAAPARAVISGATDGNNTLVAAQGAGNIIRVHSLYYVAAGTVNVRFESAADGTALDGVKSHIAYTGLMLPYNPDGWFETAANALLNMELNAAIQVSGALTYSVVT